MTWTKTPDDFTDALADSGVSRSARLLIFELYTYGNRRLLDGKIPRASVQRITDSPDFNAELVALDTADLLDLTEDHVILDWSDQECAEEVRRRQVARSDKQRRYRQRKDHHSQGDHSLCDARYCPSAVTGNADSNETRNVNGLVTPSRPDPSRPVPEGQGTGTGAPPARSARATRAGDAEEAQPPPALPLNSWPAWCKRCDNTTRLRQTEDGKMQRCPDCHPNQVAA